MLSLAGSAIVVPSASYAVVFCGFVCLFEQSRLGEDWEVKSRKDSGLTINQSKVIKSETYIVVNYKANSVVTKIWILWNAQDDFFSPRKSNTNARSLNIHDASSNIEVIFSAAR